MLRAEIAFPKKNCLLIIFLSLEFFENEISNEHLPMLDYDEEPGAPASNEMTKLEVKFNCN